MKNARNLGIQCISIYGDLELVVKQIKNKCQAKNPSLNAYRNEVWDMVYNFFVSFNIKYVPRYENRLVDSLAVVASTFQPPLNPRLRYEVEIRHKPSIRDNIKHWQVFEDEENIKDFLEMIGYFGTFEIDQEE